MKEHIVFGGSGASATAGSAGLPTQVPGTATTVGSVAAASGGIRPGSLVEPAKG